MKRFILLIGLGTMLSAQTWQSFHTGNSMLPGDRVKAVCVEPSGVKWFGTDKGLARFDGETWQVFTQTGDQQTLADNHITDIAYERTGYGPEIWVGTMNGVTVLNVDAFTFATPYRSDNRPLLSNQVNAVAIDSNHVKWFATDAGVSAFDGENWFEYTKENKKLADNHVISIGIDNECDSLWRYFGTSEKGISRFYYRELDAVTSASPYDSDWTIMMSDSISAFHVVHVNKHWIGTTFGLAEHDTIETKRLWNLYTTYEGLIHNTVLSLADGPDGSLWIGTGGGVSHFINGNFINYTTNDGLIGKRVHDIAVDLDGSLWFATNGGVSHLSNDSHAESESPLPVRDRLLTNYPNPFNPSTTMQYELSRSGLVQLSVYNIAGKEIRRLVHEIQVPGMYHAVWDGIGQSGQSVPAGVYMARLQIYGTDFTDSIKMIMLK